MTVHSGISKNHLSTKYFKSRRKLTSTLFYLVVNEYLNIHNPPDTVQISPSPEYLACGDTNIMFEFAHSFIRIIFEEVRQSHFISAE